MININYSIQEEFLQYCYQNQLPLLKNFFQKHSIEHQLLQKGLNCTVKEQFFPLALFLMKNGASLYQESENLCSFAINRQNHKILQFLLDFQIKVPSSLILLTNATIDEKIFFQSLPLLENLEPFYDHILITASKSGQLKIVEWAIQQGANIAAQNHAAIQFSTQKSNELNILQFLEKQGGDIHVENDYLLKFSAQRNQTKILSYLIQKDCDIHAKNEALIHAIEKSSFECLDLLLENQVDLTVNDYHSIFTCVQKSSSLVLEKILKNLQKKNQSIFIHNPNILSFVIREEKKNMLALLLEYCHFDLSNDIIQLSLLCQNPNISKMLNRKKIHDELNHTLLLKDTKKNMKI